MFNCFYKVQYYSFEFYSKIILWSSFLQLKTESLYLQILQRYNFFFN